MGGNEGDRQEGVSQRLTVFDYYQVMITYKRLFFLLKRALAA
jgi:hypothetical protein